MKQNEATRRATRVNWCQYTVMGAIATIGMVAGLAKVLGGVGWDDVVETAKKAVAVLKELSDAIAQWEVNQ